MCWEMRIEEITHNHLPEILSWWVARGEGEMPPGILPPLGYVASDECGPAAAAWIYLPDGCPLMMVDWMVGRPGMGPGAARAACRAVFSAIETEARRRGITRILTSTCHPAMVREMERVGFTVAARGAVHLVKIVPSER